MKCKFYVVLNFTFQWKNIAGVNHYYDQTNKNSRKQKGHNRGCKGGGDKDS